VFRWAGCRMLLGLGGRCMRVAGGGCCRLAGGGLRMERSSIRKLSDSP